MDALLILGLLGGTSLGAWGLGVRRLRLPSRALGRVARAALETVGLGVAFLLANLAVGLALILAVRTLGGPWVTVYVLDDAALGLGSLLQGLLGRWWLEARGAVAD